MPKISKNTNKSLWAPIFENIAHMKTLVFFKIMEKWKIYKMLKILHLQENQKNTKSPYYCIILWACLFGLRHRFETASPLLRRYNNIRYSLLCGRHSASPRSKNEVAVSRKITCKTHILKEGKENVPFVTII